MSREQDIQIIIKAILNTQLTYWDDPNGPEEYTCPFCHEQERGGNPDMTTFGHSLNCPYLVAKDLSTNL